MRRWGLFAYRRRALKAGYPARATMGCIAVGDASNAVIGLGEFTT